MVVVSVVIPTCNRANLLRRALDSVFAQTFTDFEILVVDDGSTDNTEQVVRQYDDPCVTYFRNKTKRGANFSRNTGISHSKGTFIAFLDDDDEWLPTKLEKQLAVFKQGNDSLGAVYTGFEMVTYDNRRVKSLPKYNGKIFHKLLEYNYVGTTSTVMVKKHVLVEINGFDEVLPSSQDWDLWLRIAKRYEFDFVPEILINYYITRNSITTNRTKTANGLFHFFLKYSQFIPASVVKSKYYLPLGVAFCFNGNIQLCRKYLFHASLANPRNMSCFVQFVLSLFGRDAFVKLYPFMTETRINYALRKFSSYP
ncbi:MAG: glycosyltransferase family 2 protein [Candidatus Bathyarchaeota archaeon]|nr:glycosyltransferase family 2 protein [Candidatus Bathyarchaeota archaeon]